MPLYYFSLLLFLGNLWIYWRWLVNYYYYLCSFIFFACPKKPFDSRSGQALQKKRAPRLGIFCLTRQKPSCSFRVAIAPFFRNALRLFWTEGSLIAFILRIWKFLHLSIPLTFLWLSKETLRLALRVGSTKEKTPFGWVFCAITKTASASLNFFQGFRIFNGQLLLYGPKGT